MNLAGMHALIFALAAGPAPAPEDWPLVAIVHATIHNPGAPPVEGVIVIDQDRIIQAGTDVAVPLGARVVDATGLHAYPAFIDAFASFGIPEAQRTNEERRRVEDEDPDPAQGPAAWTQLANRRGIHPEWRAREAFAPSENDIAAYHRAGFGAVHVVPRGGLFGGATAVINVTDAPRRREVLRGGAAEYASFTTGEPGYYPLTVLGAVASMRQFLFDVRYFADATRFSAERPDANLRLPLDDALATMADALRDDRPVVFEANSAIQIHRALDLSAEFKLKPWIAGGQEAFKVIDRLRKEKTPVILSLKCDEEPPVIKADAAPETDPDVHRDEPLRLRQERRRLWEERLKNLNTLADAGIAAAVSTRGTKDADEALANLRKAIELGLPAETALAALTTVPAQMLGVEKAVGALEAKRVANVVLFDAPFEDKKAVVRYMFVDGKRFTYSDEKKKDDGDEGDDADDLDEDAPSPEDAGEAEKPDEEKEQPSPAEEAAEPAPEWVVELDSDRKPAVHTGGSVVLRHATIYPITSPPVENTDILIRDGKIAAIGRDLPAPAGMTAIDATGWHITPGIIDCHSHIGVEEVNEYSASVTSEVRVADAIDPYEIEIYRALAGGVTTQHTMHGSANTIGGQNVTMKLRYKASPRSLPIEGAPASIKFALGENVTLKNYDADEPEDRTRFPHSRMGVESVMRQAFVAAEEYRAAKRAASATSAPIRRDLRLDALSDVLDGKIWVHCHGYRADEYLRLFAVAEDFGFRVAVMHHALEAYRMIPEIIRHGCAVSTFADDWAYKIEAYNATAYNAADLVQHGINTSVNSDSEATIRYLPIEAGKTVRWGGLSASAALALVTLNPAQQLGIANRVGSLENGKDGDLACFNGPPLDSFSKCIMTLMDGEVVFQHPRPVRAAPIRPIKPAEQSPVPIGHGLRNTYAIIGGTLHPMDGPAIEKCTVIIRDGVIESAGAQAGVPAEATIIDATGLHVWPGLIDASSVLGLREILLARATRDESDTAKMQPELLAASAINPFSAHVELARAAGITTALTRPSDGWISGQSALIDLAGWSAPEMMRREAIALHMELPTWSRDVPKKDLADKKQENAEQMRQIEEFFEAATLDAEVRGKPGAPAAPRDLRREALAPYLCGDRPVIFRADSYREIRDALSFAGKHKLHAVIDGGREAWKCAALLAESKTPVILTTVLTYPASRSEPFDSVFANAAALERAGVPFCFGSGEAANAMDLPIEVGMAVAHGLDPDRAMNALTRGAAEILGVADEIGTLAPGKVANVIVTTDYPIQVTAGVTHEFIRGEPIKLETMQTRQIARFRERPAPKLPPERSLKGPPRAPAPVTR
jgi:imidazolonepropionase-like amidohydrolase